MPRTCMWIFSRPGEVPVHRCGEKVGYVMVKDDDNRPIRQYHAFCPEHLEAAVRQDERDDE